MRLTSKFRLLVVAVFLSVLTLSSFLFHKYGHAKIVEPVALNLEVVDKDIETRTGKEHSSGTQNATFFTICRNADLQGMLSSISSVESRFNSRYHYPWVFANDEPFTSEFKEAISEAVSGHATFTTIPREYWNVPAWIDEQKMKASMAELKELKVLYADSVTYRQMCRFNSGFFYKLKALEKYKWYWRVEPDIKYACDVIEDPFKTLQENNKVYGFSIAMIEGKYTIRGLWNTTRDFFENRPWWNYGHIQDGSSDTVPGTSLGFIEDNSDTKQKIRGEYNLCHYWSNYEVADLDFFRNEEYNLYFQKLDETGNFFYERWGDAPIHSLAVSYMLPREKIHYFDNTGYYHGNIGNCPRKASVFKKLNCECDKRREYSWRAWSCVPRWFRGLELDPPQSIH